MWRFLLLLLLVVGCAQLRYSGRFQEVLVNSDPPGATVSVEGLTPLSSVAAIKGDKQFLLFSSQSSLTTPVKLVLDKERVYTVRVSYEDEERTVRLKTHFAFHPYLIVLFPIVPFVVDYDVKRFDNVFVRFGEGRLAPQKKQQQKVVKEKGTGKENQEPHKKSFLKQPVPEPGEKTPSQKKDKDKEKDKEKDNKKKPAVTPKTPAPNKKQSEKSEENKVSEEGSQSEPVEKGNK